MIRFLLLLSRQGKVRLSKWYTTMTQKDRARVIKEVCPMVLSRGPKMCNFIDWKDMTLVYRRYASLYFVVGIDGGDNELVTMEVIHQFVEGLDKYFGNVCELDLIFNFHKAYYILDELLLGGEMQEPSKKVVIQMVEAGDAEVERAKLGVGSSQERQGPAYTPRMARG
jgi:AP-1 complex subunit sigma 1/2